MNDKIFIISDIHIGSNENEDNKFSNLLNFLDFVVENSGDLIILGDLFDFWFDYKYVIAKNSYQIITKLLKLQENGVKIYFFAGNHDYWLVSYLRKCGIESYTDDALLEIGGKKFLFFHGDSLNKKDYSYFLLKFILRNRFFIFLFYLIHPDLAYLIANFSSKLSKFIHKNKGKPYEYFSKCFEKIFFVNSEVDVIISGHVHKHNYFRFIVNDKIKEAFFVGEWINEFNYLVIDKKNGNIEHKIYMKKNSPLPY